MRDCFAVFATLLLICHSYATRYYDVYIIDYTPYAILLLMASLIRLFLRRLSLLSPPCRFAFGLRAYAMRCFCLRAIIA